MKAIDLYKLSQEELQGRIADDSISQEDKMIYTGVYIRKALQGGNDFTTVINALTLDQKTKDLLTSVFNQYKTEKKLESDLAAWEQLISMPATEQPHWLKRFLEILVYGITLTFYDIQDKALLQKLTADNNKLEDGLDNYLFEVYKNNNQERINVLKKELIRNISDFVKLEDSKPKTNNINTVEMYKDNTSNKTFYKKDNEALIDEQEYKILNSQSPNLQNALQSLQNIKKLQKDLNKQIEEIDKSKTKTLAKIAADKLILEESQEVEKVNNENLAKVQLTKIVQDLSETLKQMPAVEAEIKKQKSQRINYQGFEDATIKDPAKREVLVAKFAELMVKKLREKGATYIASTKYVLVNNENDSYSVASEAIENGKSEYDHRDEIKQNTSYGLSILPRIIGFIGGDRDKHGDNVMVNTIRQAIPIDFGLSSQNFSQNSSPTMSSLEFLPSYSIRTIKSELRKAIETFKKNKVEIFRELVAAAKALDVPEDEIKNFLKALTANCDILQEAFIKAKINRQTGEAAKAKWKAATAKVKAKGNHIRSH